MNLLKVTLFLPCMFLTLTAQAHVPFLKPNQFNVTHDRLQVESALTEEPFQADFAMHSPSVLQVDSQGTQTPIVSTAKTAAAEYLEPALINSGTYRIRACVRKGPKYRARETPEGKLYFAEDIPRTQGRMTQMQYYSSADTYLTKGHSDYQPRPLKQGVEIIPLAEPNSITVNEKATFQVYENGTTVSNARVVVVYDNEHYDERRIGNLYDVENQRESNLYADENGVFTFVPEQAGLVLLFVTIHHKLEDGTWESHNTSLTLEVDLAS